jgi:hypothetical protein
VERLADQWGTPSPLDPFADTSKVPHLVVDDPDAGGYVHGLRVFSFGTWAFGTLAWLLGFTLTFEKHLD